MTTTFTNGAPWSQQAQFNNYGTELSGWALGTALPGVLDSSCVLVTDGYIYLFGGKTTVVVDTVYRAPIDSGGIIGTWETDTSLPSARRQGALFVTKDRVYIAGGNDGSVNLDSVITAGINTDGTIGTWSTSSNALPAARAAGQCIVTEDRVFYLGGWDSSWGCPVITYSAAIAWDGTIGTWSTAGDLVAGRAHPSVFTTNGHAYLVGGYDNGGTLSNVTYMAAINSDGTLGSWGNASLNLPATRGAARALCTSTRVWLLGGIITAGTTSNWATSTVNTDGTLNGWSTSANTMAASRSTHSVAVTSSRVYAIGGFSGTVSIGTVAYASFTGGFNDYTTLSYEEVYEPPEGLGVFAPLGDTFFGEGSSILPMRYGMGSCKQRVDKISGYGVNSASIGDFIIAVDNVSASGETSIIGWGTFAPPVDDVSAAGPPISSGAFVSAPDIIHAVGLSTVCGWGKITSGSSVFGQGIAVVPIVGHGDFKPIVDGLSSIGSAYLRIYGYGDFLTSGDSISGTSFQGVMGTGNFKSSPDKVSGRSFGQTASTLSYHLGTVVPGNIPAPSNPSPLHFIR